MKRIKIKKKAYSLTESLLTITAVGIVLVTTYQIFYVDFTTKQYKSNWKSMFSQLGEVTDTILSQSTNSTELTLKGEFSGANGLRDMYLKHLGYTEKCDSTATVYGKCWHATGQSYYLNGSPASWSTGFSGAILSDGTLMLFGSSGSTCAAAYGLTSNCGWMYLDINGFKKPNTVGKDIFATWITKNSLQAFNEELDTYAYSDCSTYGFSCSAEFLKES